MTLARIEPGISERKTSAVAQSKRLSDCLSVTRNDITIHINLLLEADIHYSDCKYQFHFSM